MNIFESLENLNISEECFNDILRIVEENILRGTDAELGYLIDTPKEDLRGNQRERKRALYAKRVRGLRKLLANQEATDKAGEEHQKAIENNLKECFEYVCALMEELLGESNYSAADIANKARKVLSDRKKVYTQAKKKGNFFEVRDAEDRYNHAKALASLPKTKKSGISAKTLDKAAYYSGRKRYQDFQDNDNADVDSPEDKRAQRALDMIRPNIDRECAATFNSDKSYEEAGKGFVLKQENKKNKNSGEDEHARLLRAIFGKNK